VRQLAVHAEHDIVMVKSIRPSVRPSHLDIAYIVKTFFLPFGRGMSLDSE